MLSKTYCMFKFFYSLLDVLLPRYCYGCKEVLVLGEKVLCSNCFVELSRTMNHFNKNNDLVNNISINFPIKHAVAFINYDTNSLSSHLIHKFKYNDDIIIGKYLTNLFCNELKDKVWIKEIDYVIALPLHWIRKTTRGYNQSEIIAKEIGKRFNIEHRTDCVKRIKYNKSQTKMSKEGRWKNVENIFALRNASLLEGKHILLVDDLVTTGASLNSCIKTLSTIKDIQISVLVLGKTII